jgi:hypothetical protein
MNKSNFNWTLIQSFLVVMEHGSLMRAARATGVSQPTLGRHASMNMLLPMLQLPVLPVWLTVHRELRTSARIRAVYDFWRKRSGRL